VTLPDTVPIVGIRWDDVLFLILSAVMLGSGLLVVTMRDIIRCALALIVCFGALAGIYVIIGAPLIAATQVLVYIGAIAVLILFAIMLTQSKLAPTRLVFQTQAVPAAIAAVILAILIALTVTATNWGAVSTRIQTTTDVLASVLFNQFVLPFEVVSVLLLAAVVGGVFLAKRDDAPIADGGVVPSPRTVTAPPPPAPIPPIGASDAVEPGSAAP
jgi:NADH:ubiquinone oxidoreductase subunit 6 (subunit J)